MGKTLEELRIYQFAEALSDEIWNLVLGWDRFARDTIGRQLVRAADSIGANIAEGYGRYHFREDIAFLYYARGSITETGFWLRRAVRRRLITDEKFSQLKERIAQLAPQLNAHINAVRRKAAAPRIDQGGVSQNQAGRRQLSRPGLKTISRMPSSTTPPIHESTNPRSRGRAGRDA